MTPDSEHSKIDRTSGAPITAEVVAEIREEIARDGFSVRRGAIPIGSFYHLASRLGSVLRIEDIRLGNSRRGAHSPHQLGLHTDQHYVDVIAWYCVRPAETGGETLLVDTAPLLSRRDARERALLDRVVMRCPDVDGIAPADEVPLTSSGRVYYAAWNVAPLPDPEVNAAFKRFVSDVESSPRIGIRLEIGECLFIDNRRMLHGRGVLPPDSPRLLRRFWLATGATSR